MTIDDINENPPFAPAPPPGKKSETIIKVIGVGGGGGNAVQHMYSQNIENVSFVVCNTDKQALLNSSVPVKVQLGHTGLGAGNDPDVAREAAEETAEQIANLFTDGTKMVFITAGMGGGTGTGAGPVVARIAREHGMLTIGIVTIPFLFEGSKKIRKALNGADEIRKYVDALLIINNERLTEIYPDLNFLSAFGKADDTLSIAASGISELITNDNHVINIDFNDVKTTLLNGGAAVISIGYGEGEHRVEKAIHDALESPLLKNRDILGSKRILFNIYFNPDAEQEFVMGDASELTDFISKIDRDVDVIWGLTKDNTLGNKVKITLLAAGFDENSIETPTRPIERPQLSDAAYSNAAQRPAISITQAADDIQVQVPKEADKLAQDQELRELYGDKMAAIAGSREKQRQIIFTPEMLYDDNVIDTFEKTPTFKRDRHVVDELKSSAKKSREEAAAPQKSADSSKPDESATIIHFD